MSKVRLLTFNLVTQSVTEIIPATENALFPASNLKDDRTTKEYRTTTGTTTAEVVFDFKTTEPVTDVAIVENSIQGFSVTGAITIEANFINDFTSPPFTTTLTPDETHGFGHASFAEENYRFWKITASNTVDFAGISNIYIGRNVTESPFERNIDFNWAYENRSTSKTMTNRYKQKFVDIVSKQAIYSMTFSLLSKADYESLQDAFNEHDVFEPLWFLADSAEAFSTSKERFAGYFHLNKIPQVKNTNFSRYKLNLNLRQAT